MTRVLGSLALIFGGVAWVAFALVLAGERYGDTAGVRLLRPAEPPLFIYRDGADAAPYLAAAVVLTLVGFALLYGRAAWLAGSWGKASVVMLALGALVLFAPSLPLPSSVGSSTSWGCSRSRSPLYGPASFLDRRPGC